MSLRGPPPEPPIPDVIPQRERRVRPRRALDRHARLQDEFLHRPDGIIRVRLGTRKTVQLLELIVHRGHAAHVAGLVLVFVRHHFVAQRPPPAPCPARVVDAGDGLDAAQGGVRLAPGRQRGRRHGVRGPVPHRRVRVQVVVDAKSHGVVPYPSHVPPAAPGPAAPPNGEFGPGDVEVPQNAAQRGGFLDNRCARRRAPAARTHRDRLRRRGEDEAFPRRDDHRDLRGLRRLAPPLTDPDPGNARVIRRPGEMQGARARARHSTSRPFAAGDRPVAGQLEIVLVAIAGLLAEREFDAEDHARVQPVVHEISADDGSGRSRVAPRGVAGGADDPQHPAVRDDRAAPYGGSHQPRGVLRRYRHGVHRGPRRRRVRRGRGGGLGRRDPRRRELLLRRERPIPLAAHREQQQNRRPSLRPASPS